MKTVLSLFLVLICLACTDSFVYSQSVSVKTFGEDVTAENIKALLPQKTTHWTFSGLKFHDRKYFNESQGASVYFMSSTVNYVIRIDLVYGLPNDFFEDYKEDYARFQKKLTPARYKKIETTGKVIYQNIKRPKIAIEKKNLDGNDFYIVRRDNRKYSYAKGRKLINDCLMVRYRTCSKDDYNDGCLVKNVKQASDELFEILAAFDFDRLSKLSPTAYIPPAIDAPDSYVKKYFRKTNTVVGFAYPKNWYYKSARRSERSHANIVFISRKDFVLPENFLLYKTFVRDGIFQVFAPNNVLIWFYAEGDRGDQWKPESVKINTEWIAHKLKNFKVVQPVTSLDGLNYPAACYSVEGEGSKSKSLVYKEIHFQEPSGRVFKVCILMPAAIMDAVMNDLQPFLKSIVAKH